VSARVVIVAGAPGAGGPIFVRALRECGFVTETWRAPVVEFGNGALGGGLTEINARAIAASGVDLFDPSTLDRVVTSTDTAATARTCAGSRNEASALWGWQDPNSTLLLDFWSETLPDALWIFPVRDPACHAWSFVRRHYGDRRWRSPLERARLGLRLWHAYNERVLRFVESAPDRALVVSVPSVFEGDAAVRIAHALAEYAGTKPPDGLLRRAFAAHLLTRRAPQWVRALAAFDAPSRRLAASLRERSTSGSSNGIAKPETRERVVCVVASRKGQYSETFIDAHVQRRPATVKFLHGSNLSLTDEEGVFVRGPLARARKAVRREFGLDDSASRARALSRYLRRERVEAVLAEYSTIALQMHRACVLAGIPLVVNFHGFDAYLKDRLDPYRAELPEFFRDVAACVVVSRDMARQVESLGAPPEKIVFNPCGVDVDVFANADPGTAPPTFLAVGRFVEKKGPHLTLVAFAKALEQVPEARLVMVGDGMLLAPCKQLVHALGIANRVSFLGVVDHAGIVMLMRQCRAFVQHSQRASDNNCEGTPVAVLEAGASGIPVISTVHAGIADAVVHGETGLLVGEGDVDGMARHMVEIARSPELASRMGAAARERIAREYSMDRSVARMWCVLEEAIEAASRRSVEEPFVRRAAERVT
jgi:colanic acid/amylovoran biosynthesis glycosyltransferase